MFSYYGRKKRLAPKYADPLFETVVEPFAGSAAYSLHGERWRKNVILCEKDTRIYNMWKWLQRVEPDEIMALPVLKKGEKTDDFNLIQEAQDFVGYWIAGGASRPNHTPGKGTFNGWHEKRKLQVCDDLPKIKHWDIRNISYEDMDDIEATWFIDPPYVSGGQYYRIGSKHIDYEALGEWCKSRRGQVIVCENSSADWLPFVPLATVRGQRNVTTEVIWENLTS